MRISDLSRAELAARLRRGDLCFRTGPFTVRAGSPLPELAGGVALLYGAHPLEPLDGFADFHVAVRPPAGLRRWIRPQVHFEFDGMRPFKPLPGDQGLPLLEWGLNWSIANFAQTWLIVHAGAVAKGGRAAILPGPPGSGKSTLCAALVHRGWRLLSDELTLIEPASGRIYGLARPANLKNRSIPVIQAFAPEARFSAPVHDTAKGTVALMQPPPASVAAMDEPAEPAWVVVPEYLPGSPPSMTAESRALTFIELGRNAFNYSVLGRTGFRTLADAVERCRCLRFRYSALEDAIAAFDRLAAEPAKTERAGAHA